MRRVSIKRLAAVWGRRERGERELRRSGMEKESEVVENN